MSRKRASAYEKQQRAHERRLHAIAIDRMWESLRSHLAAAVKSRRCAGNERWHADCVYDYAISIYAHATALKRLAAQDFRVNCHPSCDKL